MFARAASVAEVTNAEPGESFSVFGRTRDSKIEKRSSLDRNGCTQTIRYTQTRRFTVPRSPSFAAGTYVLTPYAPPRISTAYSVVDGRNIERSPSSLSATSEGTLPMLELLSA